MKHITLAVACLSVASLTAADAPPTAREPSAQLLEIPVVAELWTEVQAWRAIGVSDPAPVDLAPVLTAIEALSTQIGTGTGGGDGEPADLTEVNVQLKRLADRLELTLRGPVWLEGVAGEHRAAFMIESPDGGTLPDPDPEDPEDPEEPGRDLTEPFVLKAEDFTQAYDDSPGNMSNAPANSANPDVDLERTPGEPAGVNLAWWKAGEWIQWRTPEMAAGRWRIRVRVGTPHTGGIAMVSIDGADAAQIVIPNTGGWHEYQDVSADVTVQQSGTHLVRIIGIKAAANGTVSNFDYIHFTWLNDGTAQVPDPEKDKLVFAHQMLAMPPNGGGTTEALISEQLDRAAGYGIDVVELFHPEAFPQTAALYYRAAEKLGKPKVCLSFGYVGSDIRQKSRDLINQFRDSPAQHKVGPLPYVTAYHGSPQMSEITADCHYVPHIFARGPDGGVLEQATVDGLERVFDTYKGIEGIASFYPLEDWRQIHQNYFAALADEDLEFRMSISARHEPVGHKGNWRVYEGRGFQGITEQLKYAFANRARITAITLVTLNDYSEGTDLLGDARAERDLVVTSHWNSGDWPAMLARDGTIDFAQRYMEGWKTGVLPPVDGFGLWICYRLQSKSIPSGAKPNGRPGEWQKLEDAIFVAVRSVEPVAISVNGEQKTAPGGETLLSFPHKPGPVVVSWPGGSRTLPAIVQSPMPGAWKSLNIRLAGV